MPRNMNRKSYDVGELQELLGEVLDNLREGKTSPQNANATANVVGKILSTVRLQMDYQKLTGHVANVGKLLESGDVEKS